MRVPCTYIDGIGSSQTIDTHGEVVDLAGLDISSLVGAPFTWEHELDGKNPAQIVGKILQAHKIFSEKDCQNDRHHYYWNKCQLPLLYVMGRLFDDKKPSAIECAALFKDDKEHPGETPMVSFSVEGGKILVEGPLVKKSIARKVTITNLAANKTCIAQVVPAEKKSEKDELASLFKGEMALFNYEPTYTELMKKTDDLKKALTAGSGMAAPSQLQGGAVLGKESLEGKKIKKNEKSDWYKRADQAYKTWDKRDHFRGYMKKRMPHLAEGEVDAIGRMVALKKTMQAEGKLSKMYASYFAKHEIPTSENETNEIVKGTDLMMAGEELQKSFAPTPPGTEYIHGLPKGHPALGEHKGHTYRRIKPPTKGDANWHFAVRNPQGKDSTVKLPSSTGGTHDAIRSHLDSIHKTE